VARRVQQSLLLHSHSIHYSTVLFRGRQERKDLRNALTTTVHTSCNDNESIHQPTGARWQVPKKIMRTFFVDANTSNMTGGQKQDNDSIGSTFPIRLAVVYFEREMAVRWLIQDLHVKYYEYCTVADRMVDGHGTLDTCLADTVRRRYRVEIHSEPNISNSPGPTIRHRSIVVGLPVNCHLRL
jgi:hypothetical protein